MTEKFHGAFSIPNLMTYSRIVIIPFFVAAYLNGYYTSALVLLGVSALTDVADGFVARRFHMVTDIGKIADPFADKLTQGAVIFCAAMRNRSIWLLFGMLASKELVMLGFSSAAYSRTGAHSSRWYGKLCTVALYIAMAAFVIFPELPQGVVWVFIIICSGLLVMSLVLYIRYFMGFVRAADEAEKEAVANESSQ